MSMKPGAYQIGPYFLAHTAGASQQEEFEIQCRQMRNVMREILRLEGALIDLDMEIFLLFKSEEEVRKLMINAKSHVINPGLIKLLKSTSKREAERIAKDLTITKADLTSLKLNADEFGFKHKLMTKEFLPTGIEVPIMPKKLTLSDEYEKHKMTTAGKKYFRNIKAIFEQRKQIHVHLFEKKSQHHFFYFDYSDVGGNHYVFGSHVHYTSHLWNIEKASTLRGFEERGFHPASLHIKADFNDTSD